MNNRLVFISYRRSEIAAQAERLKAALDAEFHPSSIFLDSISIPAGDPWPDVLRNALERSAVVLVLIGNDWLHATDSSGRKRLHVDDDWVKGEVETALSKTGTVVIPVVLGNAPIPPDVDLPATLRRLPMLQALRLSDQTWESDAARLVSRIRSMHLIKNRPITQNDQVLFFNEAFKNFGQSTPTPAAIYCILLVSFVIFGSGAAAWLIRWLGGSWWHVAAAMLNAALTGFLATCSGIRDESIAGELHDAGPTARLIASNVAMEYSYLREEYALVPLAFFIASAICLRAFDLSEWAALGIGSVRISVFEADC